MNLIVVLLLGFIQIAVAQSGADLPLDSLDVPYMSQLRVEHRKLTKIHQCAQIWKTVDEKLRLAADLVPQRYPANKEALIGRVDLSLLARIGEMLREQHKANNLAGFMDECVEIINKYRSFSQGKEAAPMTGQSSASLDQDATTSFGESGEQKSCDIEVNAKVKELEAELAKGNSQRDELTEKVQRLQEELAGKIRELEEIASEMMEKSKQIEACNSEQSNKDTSQDLETIKAQMVADEADAAESLVKQKKQFEEDLAAKDAEIEHLRQELSSKTLAASEMESQVDSLQTKLASEERSLGDTLTDKGERITDLKRELEASNAQVKECERDLGAKDDEIRQLSSKAPSKHVVITPGPKALDEQREECLANPECKSKVSVDIQNMPPTMHKQIISIAQEGMNLHTDHKEIAEYMTEKLDQTFGPDWFAVVGDSKFGFIVTVDDACDYFSFYAGPYYMLTYVCR